MFGKLLTLLHFSMMQKVSPGNRLPDARPGVLKTGLDPYLPEQSNAGRRYYVVLASKWRHASSSKEIVVSNTDARNTTFNISR